ncbi:MAG: hypothetical protein ACLGJB_12195 [Blastocatellia bacterium]
MAITLAAECLDEARELDPGVGQSVTECVIAGLESSDPTRCRLAAEAQSSRRLKSLQRIDDQREIDLGYLTCAEYQLFLDDMREQGKYYQSNQRQVLALLAARLARLWQVRRLKPLLLFVNG